MPLAGRVRSRVILELDGRLWEARSWRRVRSVRADWRMGVFVWVVAASKSMRWSRRGRSPASSSAGVNWTTLIGPDCGAG